MTTDLTIGRLARESGVNVETIRFYHRRGILPEPARFGSGHRRYSSDHVKRVRFIRRAQSLGFTLSEVAGLLDLERHCACASAREKAVEKRALIERKIADLSAMSRALDALVQQCDQSGGGPDCPLLDSLQAD